MRADVKNFTGGITDYIQTDDVSSFEVLDNAEITKDMDVVSRFGSRLIDETWSKPVTNTTKPNAIYKYKNKRIVVYGKNILSFDGTTWEKLLGPNGEFLLTNADSDSLVDFSEWNEHLIISESKRSKTLKLFKDENGDLKVVTAGLPLPDTFSVTPASNDGATYIYTIVYKYQYTVEDVTYLDLSDTRQLQIENASITQNDLVIPELINDAQTHYDTSNIQVQIYRTENEGTASYLVGEVANGTTAYSDTVSDANLINGITLYTDGVGVRNEEPPKCKGTEIVDNACFYFAPDGYNYRVLQSLVGDFDSVPSSNIIDFEEQIVAWSSYQSNVIVFTRTQIYRIEGIVDNTGAGLQRTVRIADKVGCLSSTSVVQTDRGVYFAGVDSFYFTNGYEITKIPEENKNFYRRYRQLAIFPESIYGDYNRIEQRIYWTTRSGADYKIYVYDMTFNAFSNWNGDNGSFDTVSIFCDEQGVITRGDLSGYLFYHDENFYDDPIIDNTKLVENWNNKPVIYKVRHIDFDYGLPDINKWTTKISISGDGRTDLDMEIRSYNNSYDTFKKLKEVSFQSALVWGDENWVWGDANSVWGLELRLNQTRRFPSKNIRNKTKQIEFTNAFIQLRGSFAEDPTSQVNVNATTKLITLVDPTSYSFPENSIGKELRIAGRSYEIIDKAGDTIRVDDNSNLLIDGAQDWSIWGYAHNQRLHISSFIYTYQLLDDDGGFYQRGVSAES